VSVYTCTLSFVFQTTHVQFTDWFRRYGALTAFVALDVLVSTNTKNKYANPLRRALKCGQIEITAFWIHLHQETKRL